MANKAVAVDLGSHSAKVLVAQVGKHGVKVLRFAALPRGENSVSLREAGIPLAGATVGLAGRDMTLRYSQVPPTPDWQLRNLMDLEIQDLAQQSGGSLSADYNLLPAQDPEAGVETVLLALAKDDALSRLAGEVAGGGGSVSAYAPNCTAIYNAFLKCGPVEPDAVVAIVNIGHETTDLALVKGTDLLFARNLSGGTKVLDDAIAGAFGVASRKAEALKKDLLDLDPASRGRYASGQAEKVTMSAAGAATAIVSGIQSSVSFCKAQTKIADLRLDKVLVCGGGARLRGLRGFLREALRCPVEMFDPFGSVDLTGLPPADQEQLEAMRYEAVVALGLAVGRLDETLYSLEILPEAVKKKQRFQQRTIFNVVAALLGVALLAHQAVTGKEQVEAATRQTGRLRSQVAQANAVHTEAQGLIDANKVERAVVDHFAQLALPLHGLLRAQRALGKHLPPQLWVRKFELGAGRVAGAGTKRRTVVTIDGAGKELDGVEVGRVLNDFYGAFKADPELAGADVVLKPQPNVGDSVQFTITIDFGGES
ncbi:MAG: Type pilus biosis protein PilM [Planctomycetota bacterium]